ncbi:hypothetical protein [Nesterenkonia pannonica]|uniref:hypothetical protein n=1 Tax=Nesterenkonia pannonica TaxID=1548602 RepID=UPI0021646AB8|nr:hypothetical protein [Nesterenkonia pannonica]
MNVAYTGRFMRSRLRGLRDNNNQPIYLDGLRGDGSTPRSMVRISSTSETAPGTATRRCSWQVTATAPSWASARTCR